MTLETGSAMAAQLSDYERKMREEERGPDRFYREPPYSNPMPVPDPIGKLAEALAKAQAEMKNVNKEKTAEIKSERGSYEYRYATLADGIEAIRPALSKHGIAFTQITRPVGDTLFLYTRLIHSSGEFLESEWPVGAFARLTPQQVGSALTYARRYSLFSLVGISGQDDDDDGNQASNQKPPPPPQRSKPQSIIESGVPKLSPPDWNRIRLRFSVAKDIAALGEMVEHAKRNYDFETHRGDMDELERLSAEAAAPFYKKDGK